MPQCPECAEDITGNERVCPYCKSRLDQPPGQAGSRSGRPKNKSSAVVVVLIVAGALMLFCVPVMIALLLPALIMGSVLSHIVHHRINGGFLRNFVQIFAIVSGIVLIVHAS